MRPGVIAGGVTMECPNDVARTDLWPLSAAVALGKSQDAAA